MRAYYFYHVTNSAHARPLRAQVSFPRLICAYHCYVSPWGEAGIGWDLMSECHYYRYTSGHLTFQHETGLQKMDVEKSALVYALRAKTTSRASGRPRWRDLQRSPIPHSRRLPLPHPPHPCLSHWAGAVGYPLLCNHNENQFFRILN